jgi:cyclic pyranopterin phosphate synthase
MLDQYNRRINYLRISVTDRCNLRCRYCMPEEGVKFLPHEEILSFEEIRDVVKVGVKLGIDKIRLTGGEPLVRKGIVDLVEMIASIEGVKDLAMTTNGLLLDKFAHKLAIAGLNRINVSLDTLNPEKFSHVTRGGDVKEVIRGIETAKNAGLNPIKINCVVKSFDEQGDAEEIRSFCETHNLQVRLISQMNLYEGVFGIVQGGTGGDCSNCNRLRLTSNGLMKPCLFSDIQFSVRKLGVQRAIEMALGDKPLKGSINPSNCFYNIGG